MHTIFTFTRRAQNNQTHPFITIERRASSNVHSTRTESDNIGQTADDGRQRFRRAVFFRPRLTDGNVTRRPDTQSGMDIQQTLCVCVCYAIQRTLKNSDTPDVRRRRITFRNHSRTENTPKILGAFMFRAFAVRVVRDKLHDIHTSSRTFA